MDFPVERDRSRDVIPLFTKGYNAVSFPYILENSNVIPLLGTRPEPGTLPQSPANIRLNFLAEGEGRDALQRSTVRLLEYIKLYPPAQALLAKDHWTEADRTAWEREISTLSNMAFRDEPLFAQYRTKDPQGDRQSWERETTHRDDDLNGLPNKNLFTRDMNSATMWGEFDCEHMSIAQGVMLQTAEDLLLPAEQEAGNFKRRGTYYLAGGFVLFPGETDKDKYAQENNDHAFILTPSGSIVEGTTDFLIYAYKESRIPGYTQEHYLAGYPAVVKADDVGNETATYYTGYDGSFLDTETARQRLEILQTGGDFSKLHELTEHRPYSFAYQFKMNREREAFFQTLPPEQQAALESVWQDIASVDKRYALTSFADIQRQFQSADYVSDILPDRAQTLLDMAQNNPQAFAALKTIASELKTIHADGIISQEEQNKLLLLAEKDGIPANFTYRTRAEQGDNQWKIWQKAGEILPAASRIASQNTQESLIHPDEIIDVSIETSHHNTLPIDISVTSSASYNEASVSINFGDENEPGNIRFISGLPPELSKTKKNTSPTKG